MKPDDSTHHPLGEVGKSCRWVLEMLVLAPMRPADTYLREPRTGGSHCILSARHPFTGVKRRRHGVAGQGRPITGHPVPCR
jgi:hypothetical protein